MKIQWLGHSSFLIEDSKGRKLLTDPFDSSVGYDTYKEIADVVTISHHHFDHDYVEKIEGNPEIIDKIGFFNVCDIPIRGIPSYHDKLQGAKRGDNIIYVFTMDNYNCCHLGDLGHLLDSSYLEKIGEIDVLFIPIGGNFTLNNEEATIVAKALKSHIIIPMHYKTPNLKFQLEGVENFIINLKSVEKVKGSVLELKGKLQETNIVKLLDYTN